MDFIEELSKKRERWVESSRENGFEKGIRNLLTELYPDNAHFVYELLQNSEDAKATRVHFILDTHGLTFKHNGERLFTEKDVDSITSIGGNQKADDFNQIGKFGVGFKAVFSYTETPRVYSGDFAFEIRDLVCPKKIEFDDMASEDSTTFWFPFNHPSKTPERSVDEIRSTLKSLPDITVLFLRNITEIRWEIRDGAKEDGQIKRSNMEAQNIFEITRDAGTSTRTQWLRYTKGIPGKSQMFVAIAFRLRSVKSKKKTGGNHLKIDSSMGKAGVSIFFPAEKENSNLRFNIHAPFAATIARDSIQNRQENEDLRDLLVNLLIESLPKLKRAGLLDSSLLEVLPNRKDELSLFYAPFRDRIIYTFRTGNFTPSWKNKFRPAEQLCQASKDIKNLINDESILAALTDEKGADWVMGAQRGTRLYDFLESLEIEDWTYEDLLEKADVCFEDKEASHRILSRQSDRWMQSFYVLLGKALDESTFAWKHLQDANIVRLQDGSHSIASGAYFESELVPSSSDIALVKHEVYSYHKDGKANPKAVAFLEGLGVKAFEPADEIKIVLDEYYKKGGINFLKQSDELHLRHIRKFIKFLKDSPDEKSIFADYYIFRAESSDAKTNYYGTPSLTFVDEPYETTGLLAVQPFIGRRALWSGYLASIRNQKDFVSFLKDVGVMFRLNIGETTVSGNPDEGRLRNAVLRGARENYYRINTDYQIDNLNRMLEEPNLKISELIWKTLSQADKKVFVASYRPNVSFPVQTAPSKLIAILNDHPWIPGKDGLFYMAEDITQELLPSEFPYDNRNGWLDAIGFGKKGASDEGSTYKERLAKQLQLGSVGELEMAMQFARLSQEEKTAFGDFVMQRNLSKADEMAGEGVDAESEPDEDVSGSSHVSPPNNDPEEKAPKSGNSKRGHGGGRLNGSRNDVMPPILDDMDSEAETEADNAEEERIRGQGLAETETKQLVKARTGQGLFRANLERVESSCRLTGLTHRRFLIASHIKPWRYSSNEEKLDGNNGLLLSPHVDKLFDKGWITFLDNGTIAVANEKVKSSMEIWGLDYNQSVGDFNEEQKAYLTFHREKRFRGILQTAD